MFKIDATGMACPLPVIKTKNALKEHQTVETLVDNAIATQNLKKLAEQFGYVYHSKKENDAIYRVIIKKEQAENTNKPVIPQENSEIVNHSTNDYIVVIDTEVMGRGSDLLGATLLKTFIYSLTEQEVLPKKIICYNAGVKLVTDDSQVLADLRILKEKGTEIFACGACLDFYDLTDRVAIGEVTNMYRIVEMLRSSVSIIKP